jgi:hypothetical protein
VVALPPAGIRARRCRVITAIISTRPRLTSCLTHGISGSLKPEAFSRALRVSRFFAKMSVRHVHTIHGSLLAPRVMGVLSPRGHDASSSHAVLSICFADVSRFTTAKCPASAASGSDGCRGSRVARSSGVAAPPMRPTVASCGGLRSAWILQRATRRPASAPRLRI